MSRLSPTTPRRRKLLPAWPGRRHLRVKVQPLALAALAALGAAAPMVSGQTVIVPIGSGAGATQTVVSSQGNQHQISTATLRDGNAFSTYSQFQVGSGDVATLRMPQGANWWVNIVRDSRLRVDGTLESRISNGAIGGNVLFVDSHGMAVGPQGLINVGRFAFAAPSTAFVDRLLQGADAWSGASVSQVLSGQFDRSVTGVVDIEGRIQAIDGVSIMAGAGEGSPYAVRIPGAIVVQGRVAGSRVNLGELKSLTPLEDRDGVIDITTPGHLRLDGQLITDGSHWRAPGAVRVTAGHDMALGANSVASASGATGTDQAGGQVVFYAQNNMANEPGAQLRARGAGTGEGGFIEYSSARQLLQNDLHFDAASDLGLGGLIYLDPDDLVISATSTGLLTGGTNYVATASKTLKVATGTTINTRKVEAGADATSATVLSTGPSGSISLTAPSITIESGSKLDASVVNSTGTTPTTYTAGDITLTAKDSSNWITMLGLANANATIDVAGTLTGRNISMQAAIDSQGKYDGLSAQIGNKLLAVALKGINSPLNFTLSYTQALGDAKVYLRPTARLTATENVSIKAIGERLAGAELQSQGTTKANLSAGFTRIVGDTRLEMQSGAEISATGDVELIAASKTGVIMTAAAIGSTNEQTGEAAVASVVFAGSISDVTTKVILDPSTKVTSSTGNIAVEAAQGGYFDTQGIAKVYGTGTIGVVGALSMHKSTTSLEMGGKLTATVGNVQLNALNATTLNRTVAKSVVEVKPPVESPITLPPSKDFSSDEGKETLAANFITLADFLYEKMYAKSGQTGSSKPATQKLAGSMAWSESDHTTQTILTGATGSNPKAEISAGGNVVIDANALVGAIRNEAVATATSATKGDNAAKTAWSAALTMSDANYTTKAQVGSQAVVSGNRIAVHAATHVPDPFDWGSFSGFLETGMSKVGPTGFMASFISARSEAATLAVAGAVNLSSLSLDTRATVESGASLTSKANAASWTYTVKDVPFDSDVTDTVLTQSYKLDDFDFKSLKGFYKKTRQAVPGSNGVLLDQINIDKTYSGTVVVHAENSAHTIHIAGGIGSAAGAGGGSVGGTFSTLERNYSAKAGIGDSVKVRGSQLDVAASTQEWMMHLSPTAGKGAGIGINGIASNDLLTVNTIASISREADVEMTTGVSVRSKLDIFDYAVSGAITASSSTGVGIGIALNSVTGKTKAYIGDNDVDMLGSEQAEGSVGHVHTPSLVVDALSAGEVGVVSVAGAVAGMGDPSDPQPGAWSKLTSDIAEVQSKFGTKMAAIPILAGVSQALLSQSKATNSENNAPPSNKPPTMAIAAAGAVSFNKSDLDTTALVDSAVISASGTSTLQMNVRAISDLYQITGSGGGSFTIAKNSGTTSSSAMAGSVAVEKSDDDTTAKVINTSVTKLSDELGAFSVQALKSGERTAVAAGISTNLSAGSKKGLSIVGSVSVTTLTDDTLASVEGSSLTGNVANASLLNPTVVAYDRTQLGAGGGALSASTGKGTAGMGAAIAWVDVGGSTTASFTNTALKQVRDLNVEAFSKTKVISAGAVADVQTAPDSKGQLMGAFVFNDLGNTVEANLSSGTGASTIDVTGAVTVRAGGSPASSSLDTAIGSVRSSLAMDYQLNRTNNDYTAELKTAVGGGESVIGVAGALGGSMGTKASSAGISYSQNTITTTYRANVSGTIKAGSDFTVETRSDANIIGVAAGAGATQGKFAGMGSATVNAIGQRTEARISGADIKASSLTVNSGTYGKIFGLAGNLSISMGASGTALGGAVAYNVNASQTYTYSDYDADDDSATPALITTTFTNRSAGNEAYIGASTVDVGSGSLTVKANNVAQTQAVAAAGAVAAGSGGKGFAGTATYNEIGDVTKAVVYDASLKAGNISVMAGETANNSSALIESMAGSLSVSNKYAGALALGFNFIKKVVQADVSSSTLTATGQVLVQGNASATIRSLSATVSGSTETSIAGSSTTNEIDDTIEARMVSSSLSGGTTSELQLLAIDAATIASLAGNIAGSTGNTAAGGAVAVNKINTDTHTLLSGGSITTGDLLMKARSNNVIDTLAVGMSASKTTGVQGSVAVSRIGSSTSSLINNGAVVNADDSVAVLADSRDRMKSLAGAAGLGVSGVGAAGGIQVNFITSTTSAGIDGSSTVVNAAAKGSGLVINNDSLTSSPDLMNITAITDTIMTAPVWGTVTHLGVAVQATSIEQLGALTSVAGGGQTGVGASVNANQISGTTRAYVDSAKINQAAGANAAQDVMVRAVDHALLGSSVSTLAGGTSAGVGGAMAGEVIKRSTTAEVMDAADVRAVDDLVVKARSTNTIALVAVGAGVGGTAGVAGSGGVVLMNADTLARVDKSSLSAGDLTVQADAVQNTNLIAGTLAVGGTAGVGLSFGINVSGAKSRAWVKDTTVLADGDVQVLANNTTNELAVAATAGVGGTVGVAVGAAVTILEGNTEAIVDGASSISRRTVAGSLSGQPNNATVQLTENGAAGAPAIVSNVRITLEGPDTNINAAEQSTAKFVLRKTFKSEDENGNLIDVDQLAALGNTAQVRVTDGVRWVTATTNPDGSYTANLSTLGDGNLRVLLYTSLSDGNPAAGSPTAALNLTKQAGVNSLKVAAIENVSISHNAGAAGMAGTAGVGTSANVVVGRSKVKSQATASQIIVGNELEVSALRVADVDMITATAGVGGIAGVTGAVGVLIFGSAPSQDSQSELNSGSGSTLARVNGATNTSRVQGTGDALSDGDKSTMNSSGSYDTRAAFGGASGAHSTSAVLGSGTIVAGSVTVSSLDKTSADNNSGGLAIGGYLGISAGVAITQLGGANAAAISAGTLKSHGNITVESGTRTPSEGAPAIDSRAISGAGGLVGVGAAVSVASNETANTATLSGTVSAAGKVTVRSMDQASMRSEAYGATVGAISVGAVVSTAEQKGTVTTTVGGSVSSQGMEIVAAREGSVASKSIAGSAGVFAGAGAGATAIDTGNVSVVLSSNSSLNSGTGSLVMSAKASPSGKSEAIGVVVGGAAVGVSVARTQASTDVSVTAQGAVSLTGGELSVSAVLGSDDALLQSAAHAGSGGTLLGATGADARSYSNGKARISMPSTLTLQTIGHASFITSDGMQVKAYSTGVGVGGFAGIGIAISRADGDSTLSTELGAVQGNVKGSLTVQAKGDEEIRAQAASGGGGLVAGAGSEAKSTHNMGVTASLGVVSGQTLVVGGNLMIDAQRSVQYDNLTDTASAGAYGASAAVATAYIDGSASAGLNNNAKVQANRLQVLASNTLVRSSTSQNAEGGGGGVISGSGADVELKMEGDATARVGNNTNLTLENLLEIRAYNEMRGAANARMDVGGAIPIALVTTNIRADANADAIIGDSATINVYGESYANALSYIDIQANSISKTYGLAGAAQGNAYATAIVNNRVNLGTGTLLRSVMPVSLLAGLDRNFNRNKHFVTANADLYNHSAIPVSINPDADATLTLTNSLTVNATAVRAGGNITLGAMEGTYVVEGRGKVSDWTRDVGELMGISSEYGRSIKNLSNTATLNGEFEAGFGNKQKLYIRANGTVDADRSVGDVRWYITNEDIAGSASAYIEKLYDQLARYGDVPEVKVFVEAELSFYFSTLLREGLAETLEVKNDAGQVTGTTVVPKTGVPANFINIRDLRAGSGNIELYGNNVKGSAKLIARADSEIYIENNSPLNLRLFNMTVDANGGYALYNGTMLTKASDIGSLNKTDGTTSLQLESVNSPGAGNAAPKLFVKNTFIPGSVSYSDTATIIAPDESSAYLQADQIRAPEIRVNGTLYNKLGAVDLTNVAGSISVYAENNRYVPRLDGAEVFIRPGKNFTLSSPSVSQSVGGSPESLYAVAYSALQKKKFNDYGFTVCGTGEPGVGITYENPNCYVPGAGGVYADGSVFIGARYINVNGVIQSGRPDYSLTLTTAKVGAAIDSWRNTWSRNRAAYAVSTIQVSGPRPDDNEGEVFRRFVANQLTASQRDEEIAAIRNRRNEPVVLYDASNNRLKVMPVNVQGGVVELVGSVINTGGGEIRALDGYARMSINNQTGLGMDLMGLDTGGANGIVRITDLNKPVRDSAGNIVNYQVTTYQRGTDGVFKAITTVGRGVDAPQVGTTGYSTTSASGNTWATFSYAPLTDSTYSWTAGYEYLTEKRYWYSKSSWLGFIPGGSTSWNSIDTFVKTKNAMPEDIMVSTVVPTGSNNFSISWKPTQTAAEKQIYYRSWSKCGFLCIKKTYYVDRRTEVGMKDIFTQRVAADHAIGIKFVGYATGGLSVTSNGNIFLGGNIVNESGTVNLTTSSGMIGQLTNGAVVQGKDLNFSATKGIGEVGSPINLVTGTGFFNATSTSGDVVFHGNSGALRIKQVSTTGNVWLDGDESILGSGTGTHVSGNRIYLSAPRGSIGEFNADGSVKSLLSIQTRNSPNGGLTAYSRSGVAIRQATGNLWVNQVATGGDVYLEAGGDLIDNNRNEKRDTRTEEQLLSIWSAAALQGSAADASNALSTDITVSQYQRYWSLRNVRSVVKNSSQVVTSYVADSVNDSYQFRFSSTERQAMLDSGVSEASIAATEASRTQEVKSLHAVFGTTQYQETRDNIIAAVNTANTAANKPLIGNMSTWSDAELNNPLPKAIFSKSSSDTTTRIEEPNVVGNRVVLRPGGKIGRDEGSVVIPLRRADRIARNMEGDLTDDERLAIMSAETTDMTLNKTTWTLTVLKKDTFNVLSNRLNVSSNGFVYLGADTTAAYPNGGTANLESVTGPGEIRIKVADSIYSAAPAGTTVISGQKAILEAASGNIGTAIKPVQISLTGGTLGTLTARAASDLFIHEIGDMRVSDIYAGASVNLSTTGAIIDARPVINIPNNGDRTIRSIQADQINLDARGGAVGASDNPIVVRVGDGGVSAFSARGSSIYVAGGEGGSLSVRNMISGKDVVLLSSYGGIANSGVVSAPGLIIANAQGPISGMAYTAGESITATAVGNLEGIQASAGAGNLTLSASSGGAVRLTTASSSRLVSINAGGEISLTTSSAGTDMNLSSLSNGIRGVSLTAGEDMTLTAQGTAGDIAITSVNARLGELNVSASGHVNLTLSSSYGLNKMVASGNIVLLSTSAGAAMDLQAGGKVDALTMTAMGQLKARAGTGINAMNMSSQSADLDLATTSGSVSSQNAVAATNILMRAPAGISVSNLRTSSGGIDLAAASISGSSAQAHTLLKFVSTGSLSFGRVSSNTTGVQLSASSMDVGAASAITSLSVSTTGNADLGALGVNAPATISAGGQLNLRSLNANGLVTISAVGDASLGQISTVTGDITLSSSAGKLTASSLFAPAAIGLTSSGHMSIGSATTTTGALTASSSLGNVYLGNAMTPLALTVSAPTASVTVDSLMANSATLSAGQDVNVTRNGIVAGVFSVTAGRDTGLAQLMSSGDKVQVSAGRQLGLASATSPTLVSLSAGAGMSVINLNSGGTASLSNTLGTLSLANANVNSSLTMSSGGDLLGSNWLVNAGVVTASAATTMNLKSVIASGLITLQSTGAATLSNVMSERGALVVTSQDQLTISRGLSEQAMDVRGQLGVTASSLISTQNEVKVISSQAGVTLKSASAKTNFAAQSAGNMTITSFNVSDGTAQLTAGQDLTLRTGIASGNLTTSSTGVSTINTLISSAGKVIASAGQALRLTTAVGSAGVELSGTQGLIAKNLISESGAVSLAATAGAISVSNTMARTGLSANTADSLQMTRYSVSQGGANLVAANSMVFKAGSVYGNFSAQAGQSLVLGTLITETGNVLAKSTDANVTFSNLIAYGDVTIEGESASNEGPAIAGSTLMSQTGAVSLTASKGSTSLKSLVASDPSTFAMQAGSLRISRVSGLTRADMTISVQGGTLALPRGF